MASGLTDKQFDARAAKFRRMERVTSPFAELPAADATDAHYSTPTLVDEVEFAEWTPTGKLRHPVRRGWRPDKAASDVVRES